MAVKSLVEQYDEVKAEHPGTLLLFRKGDFYETLKDDAKTAARVLGLTVTTMKKGAADPIPMAGFPKHQLEAYLRKLLSAGFRVAVCEAS